MDKNEYKPEILGPAGDLPSYLAALAAGADAVYVGLKHFSARMQADNFSTSELAKMNELGKKEGRKLYIAFNSLLKPGDISSAARLIGRLERDVKPAALIVQDIGAVDIAKQAGFSGEIHLSTLSNVTHSKALEIAKEIGANRIILPREITKDELLAFNSKCPENMDLELFVHGALCFCVSGRCYWSSYMGGKSGLRGRCVQPCRRIYKQSKRVGRYFSSLDLSLEGFTRNLLELEKIKSWKIEGRKKGSHYVYHAVKAYRLLRDHNQEEEARKEAEALLAMALGRPKTIAKFSTAKNGTITSPNEQTSSGMLIGNIHFEEMDKRGQGINPFIKPKIDLVPYDYLRVGYEDETWHATLPVTKQVAKNGVLPLRLTARRMPKGGTPVFLIDRREEELQKILKEWHKKLEKCKGVGKEGPQDIEVDLTFPKPSKSGRILNIHLRSSLPQGKETKAARSSVMGLWLSQGTVRAISKTVLPRISWWLPPVIWQNEEEQFQHIIYEAIRKGATQFVLNSPWQKAFFKDIANVSLIAGPFCNVSNIAAIGVLKKLGFCAAIVAPELNGEDFMALPRQAALPLGIVSSGNWPMGIARQGLSGLKANEIFQSPMGEAFFARHYSQNLWIYPNWKLDLTTHLPEIEKAGYTFLVRMEESLPADLNMSQRTTTFNWSVPLL